MTTVKDFFADNYRSLFVIFSFIITIYVQHITNTSRIAELTDRCSTLEIKIEDQYEKIDAIKLDKAVFEATMTQFVSIQADLREMRGDIKELLKQR
ncbi:hypothetical protein [uncultured Parabacteroides sp.]|jgi:hypothetical protein|uniref:hypothetical protein n=1 Tax=Bacteroides xylanisolvens TaxID=371601 RepID=UPI00261A8195|nr:hypothetical protein [uncultured Parabacteroides sp.]